MLTVHVMLHHAKYGGTVEIARLRITNDTTGTKSKGNYAVESLVEDHDGGFNKVTDEGVVKGYARQALPIWYLIVSALHALGYVVPLDVTIDGRNPPSRRQRANAAAAAAKKKT